MLKNTETENLMTTVKRIILDVLKPHQPNILEFAKDIAAQGSDIHVKVSVVEVDEKTETLVVTIEGEDIQFDVIQRTIGAVGGSVHSIDEVEVSNKNTAYAQGPDTAG